MHVTVHLAPAVAEELRAGLAESAAATELVQVAEKLGVQLRPMHPGSPSPALASTFVVQANDANHANDLAARLRDCKATESAYVSPPPSMP
jgi:hypothetical protein